MRSTFEKLNLKNHKEIVVLNAPPSFEGEIAGLAGTTVVRDLKSVKEIGFWLMFVTKQKEVDTFGKLIGALAKGDAVVWFAYPKGTSKKYKCEFNRDTGWSVLRRAGFEGVRMVAIDEDWSAFRFRRVEFIKSAARDAARATTATGRSG